MSTDDRTTGRKIAAAVAPLLGDGWTFDEANEGYGGIINGPDGASLFVRIESRRAYITGHYPSRPAYGVKYHHITVAPDREAVGIAADITRRLLPLYLPDLEKANQDAAEAARAEDARVELVGEFARMPGVERYAGRTEELSLHYGEAYGHLKVSYGGKHVNIDLNYLTPDQGAVVLRALASSL